MSGMSNQDRAKKWYQETMKIHRSPNPDLQKVIAGYKKSLDYNPNDPQVIYSLSVAYLGKGEISNAVSQLQSALRLKPDMPEAWFHLGQCLMQQRDHAEAEVAYRKSIDFTEKEKRGPLFYAIAVALQAQNKIKEADECYQLGLELKPDDFAGRFQYAMFLQNTNKLDDAETILDGLLKEAPENRDVLNFRALVHARKNELPKAVECLEKAVEKNPRDAGLLFNLAQMVEQNGNPERARELLLTCLEIQPKQPGAMSRLAGIMASVDKDYDGALKLINDALDITQQDATLYFQKAAVIHEMVKAADSSDEEKAGQMRNVEQLLMKAIEMRPQFPEAQNMYAQIKQMDGAPKIDPGKLKEELDADPENKELQRKYLAFLLSSRKFEEALPIIENLLVDSPDDHGLRLNYGLVLSYLIGKDNKKVVLARNELKTAIDALDDPDPVAILRLVQLHAMMREPESALDLIEELQNLIGTDRGLRLDQAQLTQLKGVSYQQKGFFPEAALAFAETVATLESRTSGDPQVREAALRESIGSLAQVQDNLGNAEDALKNYKKWIAISPKDPQPLSRMATLYNRNQQFEEGLETLRKLEKLDPENARTLFFIALTLMDLEKREEAESCLVRALEIQPDFPDAQQRLQFLQQNRPLVAASLEELEESVAKDPNDLDDRLLLSQAYLANKQWDKAVEQLIVITEQDQSNHRALFDLSNAYIAAENPDKAIDCMIQLEERLPSDPNIRYRLAELLQGNDEVELAVKEFRNAVDMQPGNAMFQFRLGQALRDADRDDKAETHIRKAIEMQDNFPAAYYDLGLIEYTSSREEAALRSFGKAFSMNNGLFMALYYCGMIHKNSNNNLVEATKFFQSTLASKPDFGDAHYQLAMIFKEGGRANDARYHLKSALTNWPEDAFNRDSATSLLEEIGA
jgi:tetratricopeptide (TPR) repeat protein